MVIKNLAKGIFNIISSSAILAAKSEDEDLDKIWETSLKIAPSLDRHFVNTSLENEALLRIRYLLCGEVYFLKNIIEKLFRLEKKCTYLDIGDSDGYVYLVLNEVMKGYNVKYLGINLQKKAVQKIREKGLEAECTDAMEVRKRGKAYDLVSLFETLEHLVNPIEFLEGVHDVVGKRLIISVPLVQRSRVGLQYLSRNWPQNKVPTIENTHIFELSLKDWTKILTHTGWEIENQWKLKQFPSFGLNGFIMKHIWRKNII